MRRFFLDIPFQKGETVIIPRETAHHIIDVLRLKKGAKITFFDGNGNEAVAEISLNKKDNTQAVIIDKYKAINDSPVKITLGQALITSSKFEAVLQKCTELGVTTIIPFTCERSQRLSSEKTGKKMTRWEKIVTEAARQSERTIQPQIESIKKWSEIIQISSTKTLQIIAWAREEDKHLKSVLQTSTNYDKIVLLVGPEGGFSETEISEATDRGFIPVNLGKLILRTETAGPAALAMLSYHFGGGKNV